MALTKVTYSMISGAPANVVDFGADSTGTSDSSAAIVAAYTAANEIYFPEGTYLISNNVTIPYANVIVMAGGAKFSVDSGKKLKIQGSFVAPENQQLFTGNGSVTGIANVWPEWFGAVGNGTIDDQPAFQKCVTCVMDSANSAGGKAVINIGAKNYAFASTWTIYPTADVPIWVEGAGTLIGGSRLTRTSSFNGTLVSIEGSSDPTQRITDFGFRGVGLIANTLNTGIGLSFNATAGNYLIGLQESIVEDVFITGFNVGILIQKLRLVNFNRVSVWNGTITGSTIASANWCVQIKDTLNGEAGAFSGDMTWTTCQFVSNAATTYATNVLIENETSGNNLAGIRFLQCIFYNAPKQFIIYGKSGTIIGDIWINSCQFDNCAGIGIFIETDAGAQNITDIHITNNYFTAVHENCIKLASADSNKINSVIISENWSAGVNQAAVEIQKAAAVNVINNVWTGCAWTAGSVVNVTDGNAINIIGNNCGQGGSYLAGGFTHFANFVGTGDYYMVQGNNAFGLNSGGIVGNTTAAAHTSFTGNI